MFKIARFFSVLIVVLSLTFGSLGSTTLVKAQAAIPETGDAAGLSSSDWAQIKALLPATIPGAQQAYLKASNTAADDFFGGHIALDGNTVVVGASDEASHATGINGNQNDNSAPDSGAVYVFTRTGSTWSQQAYIKASNAEAGDYFGERVAISGDTLVVSAPAEDSSSTGLNGNQASNSLDNSGAVYVFTRVGDTWSQQAYIKASNTGILDNFGVSLAISGDTLVVGASLENSNAIGINGDQNNDLATYAGAAYVFVRSAGSWSQQAYLKASNTGAGDYFGYAVTISIDTIVVGALGESSNATGVNGNQADDSINHAGAAYVFTRNGSDWSQQAYIKASNPWASSSFGASMSIFENTLVVGAPGENSNATGVNGNQTDHSAGSAGAAYVFTRNGSTWSQQAYLKASNTQAGDVFGETVAIYGNTLVVGAIQEASNATGINGNQANNLAVNSGAAYVFTRSDVTWAQAIYLKASNTQTGDRFGSSVAIFGDTIIASAFTEDSNATGVNGNQQDNSASAAGAVYVFAGTPPVVASSLRTSASPTAAGSVSFKVSFSEPVSGVDVNDFALTTATGVTGAALTNVSGGPINYIVTVNTGAGSGSIRLDVVDNDSILSASSVPLGGVGAGNGNFINGEVYIHLAAKVFFSNSTEDGWVLELSENSNLGGATFSATAPVLLMGDHASNRQYRSILSFQTGSLPDTAVITDIKLKLKQQNIVGTGNPMEMLQGFMLDMKNGYFGSTPTLEAADFQFAANKICGPGSPASINNVYTFNLICGKDAINKLSTNKGTMQIRLRFKLDDNNDALTNYLSLYSGNATIQANRPQLLVTYYVP